MIYQIASQRIENVYHFTKDAPADMTDLEVLRDIMLDWEVDLFKTVRWTGSTMVLIILDALDEEGRIQLEHGPSPAIAGTGGATALPSTIALCVKHSTGLPGRSFRGRTYVGCLSSAWLASPDGTSVSNANALAGHFNALRTRAAAEGFTFCVASMYSGVQIINGRRRAIPRAEGILTPITGSSCEINFDTNRHRKAPHQV